MRKNIFLAFWLWIKFANISFLSRCSCIYKIQKSDPNKNSFPAKKILVFFFRHVEEENFFQLLNFSEELSPNLRNQWLSKYIVQSCVSHHPQYGLLFAFWSCHCHRNRRCCPAWQGGEQGGNVPIQETTATTLGHIQSKWIQIHSTDLQIILVEIRTSSRCVIDTQKALGLTLIQKTKFH